MKLPDHPIFKEIPDLWHHIVETMDEALFLVDVNQDILYFNRRAEEITGYSAEDVVGRHCLSAFRCAKCTTCCRLFDEQKIANGETEITRQDGGRVYILKNAVVLHNDAGEVIGGLETFRDITPLKLEMRRCAEARGRAEEHGKTLEAVLGSIHEGIVALDQDGRVVSISRRARQILGLEDEASSLGLTCHELLGSELCAAACDLAPDGGGRGKNEKFDTGPLRRSFERRGRTIHINEAISPLLDDEGRAVGHLLVLTELPHEVGQDEQSFHGILGQSPGMRAAVDRIRQLSSSEVTVLITGESGTGKELASRALHETSPRSSGPFLAVNCAALPEGLLESEIFGHVKGSFTGALRDRKGRVELAHGGTLFLDEIGELTLPLQSKLLRLVQERTFERIGDEKTRKADIRIVAATNRDLPVEVAAGRFREDLYYRLKVVPLRMPPLRERGQDIALLAARILEKLAGDAGRPDMHLAAASVAALLGYGWPGNVRELFNAIEYAVALTPHDLVGPADLPPEIGGSDVGEGRGAGTGAVATGEATDEAQIVLDALERNDWHRIKAAQELGINRVTLYRIMKRLGIEGPRGRRPSVLVKRAR